MADDFGLALRILGIAAGLGVFIWLLIALVRVARVSKGGGFHALGAAMMLFGWGHMRDPRNDTVAEANEGRLSRGEASGDPEGGDPEGGDPDRGDPPA